MYKYIKKISLGSIITVTLITLAIIFGSNGLIDQLFLYEVMPYYTVHATVDSHNSKQLPADAEFSEVAFAELSEVSPTTSPAPIKYDLSQMKDLSKLKQTFYSVDKKTGMPPELFDINKLITTDVTINKSLTEPKILIFHTHSREMFSNSANANEGVLGAGEHLAQIMEQKYGVKCMHVTQSFDTVNGKPQITGAYERMEPVITKILKENPSIELVIDLHRDGVSDGVRLVSQIDGKPTAKVMFFNGLCRTWNNGNLVNAPGLNNPYLATNLALSMQMQLKSNELYPTLTRKIYLNAYRYSLHMKDKSMLIEIGAQTNTKEEVWNAVDKLAEILNSVITK